MNLHLATQSGQNAFTGYGRGYVAVNGVRHQTSLLVTPDAIEPWPVPAFEALAAEHFEAVLRLNPEILIIGTGRTLRFPLPRLIRGLIAARIGVEVMDTSAACRTFNILMGEGRRVAAALILEA